MNDDTPSIDDLFEDGRAIDEALRLAAADARRLHKRLGHPMAIWRDGRVVWVAPEDIPEVMEAQEPTDDRDS
ncbi:MAG: hypothetical protein ACT4QD_01050 [Acidobacteriota bacterium]